MAFNLGARPPRSWCFFSHRPKRFWNDQKILGHFDQNDWKYRLINTVTANFNTTVKQMTEMFQQKTTDMSQRKTQPRRGREPCWRVGSRSFMKTAVLHLLYSSFRWGSLGCNGLLLWVPLRKRLKTAALGHMPIFFTVSLKFWNWRCSSFTFHVCRHENVSVLNCNDLKLRRNISRTILERFVCSAVVLVNKSPKLNSDTEIFRNH